MTPPNRPESAPNRREPVRYAGSEWVAANLKLTLSPFAVKVANILGEIYRGIYHLETGALKKAEWTHPYRVRVAVPDDSLATFDFDGMTQLVFLAHDQCVRVQLDQSGPRQIGLVFSEREREGGMSRRHPTLEDAVALHRERHPLAVEAR